MSRPLRITLIVVSILAASAALGYAAHSMNVVGLLLSMHTPPQH
ncbi:hypothetical protein [Devosia sp. 66-22]|nr:hypothetical protein [Devosia sp. 66-22]